MKGLDGKVVVVAGAATGIGAATARRLGAEGSRVAVGDIDLAGAERTAAEIRDAGGTAVAIRYDQADEASSIALVTSTVEHYGRLDLLHVNAVDTSLNAIDTDLLNLDQATWLRLLNVDLVGYAVILRAALPHLLGNGGGAIVCTSSDASVKGLDFHPGYAAAKAGIEAIVRHVASRWGREGIRINALCPFALTESAKRSIDEASLQQMLQQSCSPRLGGPEDAAGLAAYLLSDDAFYVTGQVISVTGGMTMRR
jgi:NAD(P)-dependent dehydrogenase (short-subunit alcohol dehydrogenase family)